MLDLGLSLSPWIHLIYPSMNFLACISCFGQNGKIIGLQCNSLASADSPTQGKICVLPGPLCALKSNFHHPLGHLPPKASSMDFQVVNQCTRNATGNPSLLPTITIIATCNTTQLKPLRLPQSLLRAVMAALLDFENALRTDISQFNAVFSQTKGHCCSCRSTLSHSKQVFFFALRFALLNYYPIWNRMLLAFFACQ